MVRGIYCYIDKKDNSIIYIGKDSHIDKNMRHRNHFSKSRYKEQPINRILQNNLSKYEYFVIEKGNISEKFLNALEESFIRRYQPKFNFTSGGEGEIPNKEVREKIRKNHADFSGEKNPMFGKKHSFETRGKMKKNHVCISGENHPNFGKTFFMNDKTKIKMSKSHNTTGYFRVSKKKDKACKNGFIWMYQFFDENKKNKAIYSTDIKELEKKVKNKGLLWINFKEMK